MCKLGLGNTQCDVSIELACCNSLVNQLRVADGCVGDLISELPKIRNSELFLTTITPEATRLTVIPHVYIDSRISVLVWEAIFPNPVAQ